MPVIDRRTAERAAAGAAGVLGAAAAAVAIRKLSGDGDDGDSPRGYRLRLREPAGYGLRRIALARIDTATQLLADPDADPAVAVHEARKEMKKLRSLLRLVRPVIGEELYARENARYREAAGILSATRDAQVLSETVEALAERFGEEPPPGGWKAVRSAIAAATPASELARARAEAAARIEAGRWAIATLPLPGERDEVLCPGLERAYARGRRRLGDARERPTDERLHELRKRAKDHWYHLRLLRDGNRDELEPLVDDAHELSDLLGDDHDLVVLGAWLKRPEIELSAVQREHLGELIERRRAELQARAFGLAERLYAPRPKRFAARVAGYWAAASER